MYIFVVSIIKKVTVLYVNPFILYYFDNKTFIILFNTLNIHKTSQNGQNSADVPGQADPTRLYQITCFNKNSRRLITQSHKVRHYQVNKSMLQRYQKQSKKQTYWSESRNFMVQKSKY